MAPLLLREAALVHCTLLPSLRETSPPGATGHPIDITDAIAMSTLMADIQPDVVFHLAGSASVGESFSNPDGTWRTNVDGTRGVLEGLRRGSPGARAIVALSGEEYGRVPLEELPVTEHTPLNPISPYAKSKVAADHLCEEYRRNHGLQVIRVRAFNQIGPGQDTRFLLPSICQQIARAEALGERSCTLKLGSLDTRRDILDVRDVVAAYRLLADKGDPDRVYLAGSGRSWAVQEIVDLAVSFAKIPVEVTSDPSRRREGEQPDLYADPVALLQLGWTPRIPIHQSIADTLAYWRQRIAEEES